MALFQVEVACGKHGAASGMGPGKGYSLLVLSHYREFICSLDRFPSVIAPSFILEPPSVNT